MTKEEAARQLAIIVAEMRLALDADDPDCPAWPDQLLVIADALDPSGFVDESAVSSIDTRYGADAEALAVQRDNLRARLHRIYAAATTDADLQGLAVRDFLVRESEVAALPDVIVGLVPVDEGADSSTPQHQAPCGCKWYVDGTVYKCLSHRGDVETS